MKKLTTLFAVALVAMTAMTTANAMDFYASKAGDLIDARGTVEAGDFERFARVLEVSHNVDTIFIDSDGGNSEVIQEMSNLIRTKQLTTAVDNSSVCIDECVMLFMGGKKREFYNGGNNRRFGFSKDVALTDFIFMIQMAGEKQALELGELMVEVADAEEMVFVSSRDLEYAGIVNRIRKTEDQKSGGRKAVEFVGDAASGVLSIGKKFISIFD